MLLFLCPVASLQVHLPAQNTLSIGIRTDRECNASTFKHLCVIICVNISEQLHLLFTIDYKLPVSLKVKRE
jgi:hypothetical protein